MRDFDPTASEFVSSGFLRHSSPDAPAPRRYLPAAVVTAMMVGAAVGAVTAAISGGNILKGALFGAIGGGIASGISAAFGAASGGAGGAAGGVAGDVAAGAAGAAGDVAAAGAGAAPFEAGFVGTEAVSGAAGTGLSAGGAGAAAAGAPATIGTGMEAAIDPSMASGAGNTGLSMGDIGATQGAADTGLAGVPPPPNPDLGGGSFLDALLNKGKGMLNSRFATGMAGNVLSGYSQGKMAEAKMAEQRRLIEDARANARFGNVGSRYGGMIYAPTTYK